MKNSKISRLVLTIGIVIGLALTVLVLSIIGQENSEKFQSNLNSTSRISILEDSDCITINVIGRGEVQYKPKYILLNIIVRNPVPTLELDKAYNEVIKIGNDITKLLINSGFTVRIESISIEPVYKYPYTLVGYTVTYYIRANTSIDNIGTVSRIIPKIVNKYSVLKISYEADNTHEVYYKALRKAVENGIQKLRIIATLLNMSKVEIVNIRESSTVMTPPYYAKSVSSGTSPVIAPSYYTEHATVIITAKLCR